MASKDRHANRLTDRVTGQFKSLMYPLMGSVLLLLLISCSNVANLLMARATARESEIAVRASLGASRGRLIRQLLIETSVLAAAGCVAGCLLADLGIKAIVPIIPYNAFPQEAVINLNSKVLLFSLGTAALTTFLCGLAPAFRSLGRDLQSQFTGAGKGVHTDFRHGKSRAALVISEVALSMVLLVAAGLMMRTFFALTHVELGFAPEQVLTARATLPATSYRKPEQRKQFYEQLLDRVRSIPGVMSASQSVGMPPDSGESEVTVSGKAHSEKWHARVDLVSDGYFQTIGLRLLRGRLLTADDVGSGRRFVVVNQLLAKQFFANEDPIGRQIKFNVLDELADAPHDAYFEVIAVSDARNRGLQNVPAPGGYLPASVTSDSDRFLMIKSPRSPESLWPAIRHAVWELDSNVALTDVGSLESWMQRDTFAFPQFELATMAAFAGIGLLLVMIGIFSVMAYAVSLRTHEIGVRMALGAQRNDVLHMVLRKGLALVAAGLFLGELVSVALTRYLASQLWGVSVRDPWTYGAVAFCIVLVGLASCLAPARRAAKVDPMVALRYE